jgi:carbon monoxide dehydrogenase subunit G
MQLVNEFVVPRNIDETWAVLTDVERIAPAMPGAELTEITPEGQYHGTVKVKVGPVTAKYGGVASFRELDQKNYHMVLDATGKESSGRGRASALITANLAPEGSDTRVTVTTDLTISGPLAQFGRGAIAEVSSRLLKQFVDQLKETVLADGGGGAGSGAVVTDAGAAASVATGGGGSSGTGAEGSGSAGSVAASGAEASGAAASGAAASTGSGVAVSAGSASGGSGSAASGSGGSGSSAPVVAEVNLLKVAAWPILKRALPLVAGVVVVVGLLVWWLRK